MECIVQELPMTSRSASKEAILPPQLPEKGHSLARETARWVYCYTSRKVLCRVLQRALSGARLYQSAISKRTLQRKTDGAEQPVMPAAMFPDDELRILQKKLAEVEMERDILKKALAIFSK